MRHSAGECHKAEPADKLTLNLSNKAQSILARNLYMLYWCFGHSQPKT